MPTATKTPTTPKTPTSPKSPGNLSVQYHGSAGSPTKTPKSSKSKSSSNHTPTPTPSPMEEIPKVKPSLDTVQSSSDNPYKSTNLKVERKVKKKSRLNRSKSVERFNADNSHKGCISTFCG